MYDQGLGVPENVAEAVKVVSQGRRAGFPITLERLAAWLPMLKSRGIESVTVTALANKQALR